MNEGQKQYYDAIAHNTKRLIIFWHGIVIRMRPLIIQLGIITTVITLHPELIKSDSKSIILMACFIVGALTNSAASAFKERKD